MRTSPLWNTLAASAPSTAASTKTSRKCSGAPEHFRDVFVEAAVDGALAASVFHSGEVRIPDLKKTLTDAGIDVRI